MEKRDKIIHVTVHILIWLVAIFLYITIPKEFHANFIMMYGVWSVAVIVIIAIAVFLSVVYIPLILKRKDLIINFLITTVLSIVFFQVFILFDNADAKFSTNNWIEYPESRLSMYHDLLNHDIIGLPEHQVVSLMGEPDSITENGDYVYGGGSHFFVYISFENGIADKIWDEDYF